MCVALKGSQAVGGSEQVIRGWGRIVALTAQKEQLEGLPVHSDMAVVVWRW